METMQKTLHGMQMGETTTECFVIMPIPPSGRKLIVCIQISAKRQEILGLDLPLMECFVIMPIPLIGQQVFERVKDLNTIFGNT